MYQSEIPQETTRERERERERTLSKLEGNKIETSGGFERERESERVFIFRKNFSLIPIF